MQSRIRRYKWFSKFIVDHYNILREQHCVFPNRGCPVLNIIIIHRHVYRYTRGWPVLGWTFRRRKRILRGYTLPYSLYGVISYLLRLSIGTYVNKFIWKFYLFFVHRKDWLFFCCAQTIYSIFTRQAFSSNR